MKMPFNECEIHYPQSFVRQVRASPQMGVSCENVEAL